jgi:hypothetical protein
MDWNEIAEDDRYKQKTKEEKRDVFSKWVPLQRAEIYKAIDSGEADESLLKEFHNKVDEKYEDDFGSEFFSWETAKSVGESLSYMGGSLAKGASQSRGSYAYSEEERDAAKARQDAFMDILTKKGKNFWEGIKRGTRFKEGDKVDDLFEKGLSVFDNDSLTKEEKQDKINLIQADYYKAIADKNQDHSAEKYKLDERKSFLNKDNSMLIKAYIKTRDPAIKDALNRRMTEALDDTKRDKEIQEAFKRYEPDFEDMEEGSRKEFLKGVMEYSTSLDEMALDMAVNVFAAGAGKAITTGVGKLMPSLSKRVPSVVGKGAAIGIGGAEEVGVELLTAYIDDPFLSPREIDQISTVALASGVSMQATGQVPGIVSEVKGYVSDKKAEAPTTEADADIDMSEYRNTVQSRAEEMKNELGEDFEVYDTLDDMEDGWVKEKAQKSPDGLGVEAFINPDTGKVVYNVSGIKKRSEQLGISVDERMGQLSNHEIVTHKGIKRIFADQNEFNQFHEDIYNSFESEIEGEIKELYPEYDSNTQDGKIKLAEEYLAKMSEDMDFKSSTWDNVVEKFSKMIKTFNPNYSGLTKAELRNTLRTSYNGLREKAAKDRAADIPNTDSQPNPSSDQGKTTKLLGSKLRVPEQDPNYISSDQGNKRGKLIQNIKEKGDDTTAPIAEKLEKENKYKTKSLDQSLKDGRTTWDNLVSDNGGDVNAAIIEGINELERSDIFGLFGDNIDAITGFAMDIYQAISDNIANETNPQNIRRLEAQQKRILRRMRDSGKNAGRFINSLKAWTGANSESHVSKSFKKAFEQKVTETSDRNLVENISKSDSQVNSDTLDTIIDELIDATSDEIRDKALIDSVSELDSIEVTEEDLRKEDDAGSIKAEKESKKADKEASAFTFRQAVKELGGVKIPDDKAGGEYDEYPELGIDNTSEFWDLMDANGPLEGDIQAQMELEAMSQVEDLASDTLDMQVGDSVSRSDLTFEADGSQESLGRPVTGEYLNTDILDFKPEQVYEYKNPREKDKTLTVDEDGNLRDENNNKWGVAGLFSDPDATLTLTEDSNRGSIPFSRFKLDQDYNKAVESGDVKIAQKLVNEAAEEAGYVNTLYHGTRDEWTSWDPDKAGGLINLALSESVSNIYAEGMGGGRSNFVPVITDNKTGKEYKQVFDNAGVLQYWELGDKKITQYDYIELEIGDASVSIPGSSVKKLKTKINKALHLTKRNSENAKEVFKDFKEADGLAAYSTIEFIKKNGYLPWNQTKQEHFHKHWKKEIVPQLKEKGYDAIYYKDDGHDTVAVFDSNQIKSSDPITYDDKGNVIPLSERFDTSKEDIRFSRFKDPKTAFNGLSPSEIKTVQSNMPAFVKVLSKEINKSGDELGTYEAVARKETGLTIDKANNFAKNYFNFVKSKIKSTNAKINKAIKSKPKDAVELAIEKLIREFAGGVNPKSKNVSDPELQALVSNVRKAMNEAIKTEQANRGIDPKKVKKKTDSEILAIALNEYSTYIDLWNEFETKMEEKYKNNPSKLAEFESIFSAAPDLNISDRVFRGTLNEMQKKIGKKLRDVVKEAKENTSTEISFKEALIAEAVATMGLDPDKAQIFATRVDTVFKEMASKARADARAKIVERHQATVGNKSKLNKEQKTALTKLVEADNLNVFNEEDSFNAVAESLGLPSYTPEIAREVRGYIDAIQKEPKDSVQQRAAIMKLEQYLADTIGIDSIELMYSIYLTAMLSGYTTQAINGISGLANLAISSPSLVFSEIIKNKGVGAKDLPLLGFAALWSLVKALKPAASKARYAALSGVTAGDFTKNMFDPKAIDTARLGGGRKLKYKTNSRLANAFASIYKIPVYGHLFNFNKIMSRGLISMDAFVREMAYQQKTHVMAVAISRSNGVPYSKAIKTANDLTYRTPAKIEAARKQAIREGATKSQVEARTLQIIEEKIDADINVAGEAYSGRISFNEPTRTTINGMGARIITGGMNLYGMKDKHPFLRNAAFGLKALIFPFVNIVANVSDRLMDFDPVLSSGRLGIDSIMEDDYRGSEAQFQQAGDLITGSLMLMTALYLAMESDEEGVPLLDIKLKLSDDRAESYTKRGAGEADFSFTMNLGGWRTPSIVFKDMPFARVFMTVGVVQDRLRSGKEVDMEAFGAWIHQSKEMWTSMTFISSFETLTGLLSNDKPIESFGQALGRLTGGVPARLTAPGQNFALQLDRAFTKGTVENKSIKDNLVRNYAIFRHYLKPMLNNFGEPIKSVPSQRFWDLFAPIDDVSKFFSDNNIHIGSPSRPKIKVGEDNDPRRLNDDEAYEYHQRSSKIYMEELMPIINDEIKYVKTQEDTESLQRYIDNSVSKIRGMVRAEMEEEANRARK